MPLPIPKKNETQQKFIARCSKIVYDEMTDKQKLHKAHVAICYSQWRKFHKDKKRSKESFIINVEHLSIYN
jgi:hypothetical protein